MGSTLLICTDMNTSFYNMYSSKNLLNAVQARTAALPLLSTRYITTPAYTGVWGSSLYGSSLYDNRFWGSSLYGLNRGYYSSLWNRSFLGYPLRSGLWNNGLYRGLYSNYWNNGLYGNGLYGSSLFYPRAYGAW